VGCKRTINGKKQTVYYGFYCIDNLHHVFNAKTLRATFRYNGTTYRVPSHSPNHVEGLFYEMVHHDSIAKAMNQKQTASINSIQNIGSPTCPLRCVRPEIRRIQDHEEWQHEVEDRLKRTYWRRYGRNLVIMRE
jgi:hypothetical protein